MLKTPILLIIFKRLDTTLKVLEKIREVKPERLFIAADGPRPHVENEVEKSKHARSIVDHIDWDCEVKTLFRDENLGCGLGPSSAISWFFENVEEGIILEDDCLPDKSFFFFCEEMLNRYKNDTRMMHIGGTNHHMGKKYGEASYFFSRINSCWGWATWKRAWQYFDYEMKMFEKFKKAQKIYDIFPNQEMATFKLQKFETGYENIVKGVWDYQWQFSFLSQSGIAIMPNKNLIKNIGFDEDATHTHHSGSKYQQNIHLEALELPLIHPEFIIVSQEADINLYNEWYKAVPPTNLDKVKSMIPQPIKNAIKRLI
ncbi:nucleotide-diphospho-sugar transferase [marine bacterium AO1-C]|nr:nucleotide-diphospho-sugar transferase [marine bacterium AO1-C]